MRELPEIEVLRRELEREVATRKVKEVTAAGMALLPRYANRKGFTSKLEGVKITGVTRKGLHLIAALDDGNLLVITLAGSGKIRRHQAKDATEPGTQIVIAFTQGPQLRFVDASGDGEMFVCAPEELAEALPEIDQLGFDPVESALSWLRFGELVMRQRNKLKLVMQDPKVVVGIGDLYADEILFEAGLRYDRPSDSLSTQEIRRLYRSLVEILHDAIKHRGTTLEGDDFGDLAGQPGGYGEFLQVYGREGQLSPRSRTPIRKIKFNGRWTYYCDTQV